MPEVKVKQKSNVGLPAYQWEGEGVHELPEWLQGFVNTVSSGEDGTLTLADGSTVNRGDYVVRASSNIAYVLDEEEFKENYDILKEKESK